MRETHVKANGQPANAGFMLFYLLKEWMAPNYRQPYRQTLSLLGLRPFYLKTDVYSDDLSVEEMMVNRWTDYKSFGAKLGVLPPFNKGDNWYKEALFQVTKIRARSEARFDNIRNYFSAHVNLFDKELNAELKLRTKVYYFTSAIRERCGANCVMIQAALEGSEMALASFFLANQVKEWYMEAFYPLEWAAQKTSENMIAEAVERQFQGLTLGSRFFLSA